MPINHLAIKKKISPWAFVPRLYTFTVIWVDLGARGALEAVPRSIPIDSSLGAIGMPLGATSPITTIMAYTAPRASSDNPFHT